MLICKEMIALSNWTNHRSIQIENSVIRIHADHMEHVKCLETRMPASVTMDGGKAPFSHHFSSFDGRHESLPVM